MKRMLDKIDFLRKSLQYEEIIKLCNDFIKNFDLTAHKENELAIIFFNIGLAYEYLEQNENALENYTKAIELEPKEFFYYYMRGKLKYCLYEYKESVEDFNKAIEIAPIHAISYYRRSLSEYELELYEEALKDINTALELQPNDEEFLELQEKYLVSIKNKNGEIYD